MKFQPEETIFRFLFTSPTYFVGETHQENFSLTVVFPSFDGRGVIESDGAYARSSFLLSIEVPKQEAGRGVVTPMYNQIGDEVSALIGAFFGKLVVNLGHFQAGKYLTIPRTWDKRCNSYAKPPFNGKPRKPYGTSLELSQATQLISAYFDDQREDERLAYLLRACEFYRMALENYDARPEMAFTLLISALESLVELSEFTDSELYDDGLLKDLELVAKHCPDGLKLVSRLRGRLRQIKRRVALLVDKFTPDSFFDQREALISFGVIKDRAELKSRIRAAYDIRSRLLHTGNRSGIEHIAHSYQECEVILGVPVLPDSSLVKQLCDSLNLTGLERVTATVLRTAIEKSLLTGGIAKT
jgi:hypothetical protein